jgi:hypothetical protein
MKRELESEREFGFVLHGVLLNLSNAAVMLVARVKDGCSKGTGVHDARYGGEGGLHEN